MSKEKSDKRQDLPPVEIDVAKIICDSKAEKITNNLGYGFKVERLVKELLG